MHFSFGHCHELYCKDCPSVSLETGNATYTWTLEQGTYIEQVQEDVGDMKSVDISEGCKYRYFIRLWIIDGVTLYAGM